MRVKTGTVRHDNHKKIIKAAKGYIGRRKSVFKLAKQATIKAGQYAYRDRRNKKRSMRALWIIRLNAAVRAEGMTYSQFIKKLTEKNITINRKILADLALKEPNAFAAVVAKVK
jgi:large subunit ribosomal protein L20